MDHKERLVSSLRDDLRVFMTPKTAKRKWLTQRVEIFEVGEARRYLAGVRALADEGARTSDLRVLILALRVLQGLSATIERMLDQIA